MYQIEAKCLELKGTSYEIGQALGETIARIPPLKAVMTSGSGLDAQDASLAESLLDRWCPGLNEEIRGLADALGVKPAEITFYGMTYLKPRCSQMALLPAITENGHTMLARSYEFSPRYEDFTLARTSVKGKYAHLGSTVLELGRDEGMNEHGLGVAMSSCGFPVGTPENMRPPAIRGLQFWAVIRTLLENCKGVDEALTFIEGMPIAYNLNMILADAKGHAALVETMDGNTAVKRADGLNFLHATNHAVLPELKPYEKTVMRNSIVRYDAIRSFLGGARGVKAEDIKSLLLRKYPEGLCCRDYEGFFGTTKSIVMDVNAGTMDLCWGGSAENGWRRYSVRETLPEGTQKIALVQEASPAGFLDMIPV
jgi:predicted choloylglycine hydrolase